MKAKSRALEGFRTKLKGDLGARSFALTKAQAHDYYKAKKNKKKLPVLKKQEDEHDTPYKKLTIEEYEKKYL